jgi:hypothetical protein
MNVFEAKKILGLSENWTEDDLKKSYRTLAMKYHPDKCKTGDSSNFIKIQQAYELLSKESESEEPFDDLLSNLFKSFKSFNFNVNVAPKPTFFIKELEISPKEYFTGTVREISTPVQCQCEEFICTYCAGCGFKNVHPLESCMECLGNGTFKTCGCKQIVRIVIEPLPNISFGNFKIKIDDPKYTFINGKLFYLFDISLKESLVGFSKTFKDPFDNIHTILIKNTIVKQNDGYIVKFESYEITLLFNVIYPTKLSKLAKMKLEEIYF